MAVDATSATISGGIDLGWQITAGGVDLTHATTTYLADRPESDWPAETRLGGFRYERFAYATDAASRIAWLSGLRPHDPRTWEQAARVLRVGGDQTGADELLIAQRRHARRTRTAAQGRRTQTAAVGRCDASTRSTPWCRSSTSSNARPGIQAPTVAELSSNGG